jgi:hypothetical protein
MYPCYLFKDCPQILKSTQGYFPDDATSDDNDGDGEPTAAARQLVSLLKDEASYYVISAEKINDILNVENYIRDWPLIPKQELICFRDPTSAALRVSLVA